MKKVASPDLRVYIVWIPILPGDDAEDAASAAARFTDPRETHYYDAEQSLGQDLGRALSINPSKYERDSDHGIAWDVYLLYPRAATWAGGAPVPAYWMHQLSQISAELAPRLDTAQLLARVTTAIGGSN